MPEPRVAVLPADHARHEPLSAAVAAGGGELADVEDARAIVWADPRDPRDLGELLVAHEGVGWVQLPFAGIEPFLGVLDHDRVWTSGKGIYAEPVAEHALGLALAGMRGAVRYARERTWSAPYGHNLLGARVTILGGGGITESLVRLLGPFDARIRVVRNRPQPMPGVDEVWGSDRLHEALRGADLVVLALALTPDTRGVIDAAALDAMEPHAWLVNVARGGHVRHDDLLAAVRDGRIGGAALDVTDPEPLPDDHPLWSTDNVIVTPHVGNTPEMGLRLLSERVRENVRRFAAGEPLLGVVEVDLGY